MNQQLNRVQVGDGVYFSSLSDPKFKHNRISVNLVLPLAYETASEYAMLPSLLRRGCKSCPDFSALNARLDELYGAAIYADILKYNAYQILNLTVRSLDNRYALQGEDLLRECTALLADLVLSPNFNQQGLFSTEEVELEKRNLIDTIEAEINEKRSYATIQCIQHMCKGEPHAVRRYGYTETAAQITAESASAAWKRAVTTAGVEIIAVGCGNLEGVREVFRERFAQVERKPLATPFIEMGAKAGEVKHIAEQMEISQAKLVMGMRSGNNSTQEEIDAMRVFTAMYGGTPFSKLFINVREKLSLCYYCSVRFDPSTGLVIVDSGIEAKNMELARDEIMRQLAVMQEGGFDGEEHENTLKLMENSILNVSDNLAALDAWYLAQIMRGRSTSPAEDAANLRKLTRHQIMQAAKNVALDTVYLLEGKEDEAV